MQSDHLTRRGLLAGGAGALAAGMLHPTGALAALAPVPHPALSVTEVGRLAAGATRTLALARLADLVGVAWRGPTVAAGIQLRFPGADGRWSPWVAAGAHGHGPDTADCAGARVGEPIWTGGTAVVQLRAQTALEGVTLHTIDVSAGTGARLLAARRGGPFARLAAALPPATPVLQAGPGQPPILARRGWAQGVAKPRVTPSYGAVRMAFVHHTENPNGYASAEVPAMLRAIYAFHRYVNGWDDIGYNFVVDLYGRIFEARAGGIDEPVVGAHAGGYNLVSSGVAVLGSFMGTPISAAARHALERLLAWKLSLHGLPSEGRVTVRVNPAGAVYSRFPANARVPLPRIAGHRDGDSTDCPGNVLYGQLPAVRAGVGRLAPSPLRLTLAEQPAAATPVAPTPAPNPPPTTPGTAPGPAGAPGATPGAEAPTPSASATLTGTLRLLDGTPVAGAPIEIQARSVPRHGEAVSEQTLGEAVTDAQGAFALAASFAAPAPAHTSVWLRALYVGSPADGASVSEPLRATLAAPLSAPPAAPAPTAPAPVPPAS